jgi:hypothetical protein
MSKSSFESTVKLPSTTSERIAKKIKELNETIILMAL